MASAGPPNMYGPNATAPIGGAEEQDAGLDLWGFLKRRKSFIIILALLGTGIGYMLFQRQIPSFRSSAWVQVIHRSPDPMLGGMMAKRDLSDAAYVVSSPSIVTPAYEKHHLKDLQLLQGLAPTDAADRISSMLEVKATHSNVLEIAVEASRADEVSAIANALAQEYVDQQMENYQDARVEVEKLLTIAREGLHTELQVKEQEYNEFRAKSGLMGDGKNPYRDTQQIMLQQLASLALRETALRAELSSMEDAFLTGGSREALLLLIGKTNENTSRSGLLTDLLMEQSDLESQVGPDHPRVEAVKRKIQFTRAHAGMPAGLNIDGEEVPRQDFIAVYLQSLRQELLTIEKERGDLTLQTTNVEKLARTLADDENEDRSRKSTMERLSRLFDEVSTQMSQTNVNASMGGVKALILTRARHGVLVFPKLSQFLGLGAFIGVFAGMALGYLVELADRSFRRPEDIIREFGVSILGHIPFMTDERLKGIPSEFLMDKTAICAHSPRSCPAEAFRSVRTAVCFSAVGSSHRVIQVTSPAAGDGKSTLALNLAITMAMSGKRTILVESDLRRPKVHKLTGVLNICGIVDVLRSEAELSDAVQSTCVEELFVLPCGSRPKNPSELLSRPEYTQLLAVLREQYDYVIVDTPPVLAITDATSVAPRVDGVLIAMRLSRHTRDLGRRTLEQLREVGATITGIVINGVEESDGYGYGSYRYSDYKYYDKSCNYKDGYNSGKNAYNKDDYYSDDASPETGSTQGHRALRRSVVS